MVLFQAANEDRDLDNDKKHLVTEWAKQKTNLEKHHREECLLYFDIPEQKELLGIDEKIKKVCERKKIDLRIKFLKFGIQLLDDVITLHRQKCKNPNCDYDTRYYQYKEILESILEKEIRIEKGNANEKKPFNRIQWKGTQKELAELFIELERKGWIAKKETKAIQNCFTNSKSIDQYLRPATDKKTKEPTYEKVYFETEYIPKFYGIRENNKSN